jgi:DNA-binding phage protein
MGTRRFGRHVRRAEPNQRAAFVAVVQLIKSGRFSVSYIADRTGHNKVTIRHWLNESTQQPRIDTLLNVARLYGLKSMRTLCAMTPNQSGRVERQKHSRVNRTTSRLGRM